MGGYLWLRGLHRLEPMHLEMQSLLSQILVFFA